MKYNIICGNSEQKLKELEDNSIDLIATDPPYGIRFLGKHWDKALPPKEIWEECLRVLKPGASAVIMSGVRLDQLWRMCRDLEESGFELNQTSFHWTYFSGFPKGQDMSKRADKLAGEEREVVGKNPNGRCKLSEVYQLGFSNKDNVDITAPSTQLAKELDGIFSKGKVKPAWEIIIWARKPSKLTDYENQIAHGVGGVNCGKCMIPFSDKKDKDYLHLVASYDNEYHTSQGFFCHKTIKSQSKDLSGRFPANVLCTDSSLGSNSKYFDIDKWAEKNNIKEDSDWFNALEAGIIQIPKASKKEKNEGCEELEEKILETSTDATFSKKYYNGKIVKRTNNHPTCKPVKLFSYLISFLLPNKNCTVLDPFMGSGTTGVEN